MNSSNPLGRQSGRSHRNDDLWFDSLVQSQKTPSRGRTAHGEEPQAPMTQVSTDDATRNATTRQATAERISETSGKIIGVWAPQREDSRESRTAGTSSNRNLTIRLHHQQIFHEEGCKPHVASDVMRGVRSEFDSSAPLHARLTGNMNFKYKEPPPPLSWKPASAVPPKPPNFLHSRMSPSERIKAVEWRYFGSRNHISSPASQPFHKQHGVPRDWNDTRGMGITAPKPVTLAAYAAGRREAEGDPGRDSVLGDSTIPDASNSSVRKFDLTRGFGESREGRKMTPPDVSVTSALPAFGAGTLYLDAPLTTSIKAFKGAVDKGLQGTLIRQEARNRGARGWAPPWQEPLYQ